MADLSQYDPVFQAAGEEWNVDPKLLKAMAAQESGGNARAQSPAGAQGLMQIIPSTQKALGVTDPNDPVQSIYGGAKYMSAALDAEKSPEDALRYYHGGPGWRSNYGPESKAYAPAVTAHYQRLAGAVAPVPARVQLAQAGNVATDATPSPQGGSQPVPASPATDTAASPFAAALEAAKAGGGTSDAPAASPFAAALEAAKAATKEAPATPPAETPAVDDYGRPIGPVTNDPAVTAAGGRIAAAAADAYRGTPPILTPEARRAVEQAGPVGNYLVSPLAQIGGAVLGGMNALAGAGMQAVSEGATALGQPALGRDLTMMAQVAPAAPMSLVHPPFPRFPGNALDMPRGPAQTAEAYPARAAPMAPAPAFVPPDAPLPPQQPMPAPAFVPPAAAAREATPAAANVNVPGEARSVGAAASRDMSEPGTFGMTPEQATAYRSTAEGQKLLEAQQPGVPDRNAYVPGVNPNAADLEQSVNTSRELKALKLTAPAVSEEARAAAAANNDARRLHFEQIAGSDVSTMNARAARAAQAETDLRRTWAGKSDANAQPVMDAAAEIKASPDGRRPLVRGALDAVTKELYDADGKMLTDPEQLYGVRKHIDDLMSREAAADDPKSVRASAALGRLKQSLDAVIEQSAPGFQQYLKNFSEASRPIDAMEVLQKHEAKLYDAQNRMQYSRVQSMMRQIVDARSSPGLNPYKSIPDETMQQLWALRDDLRRSAGAEELARTTGSDTAQNAWDMAKDLSKMGGAAALHAGANLVSPGFGSMAVQGAKNMLAPIFSARTARRQTARGMEMLHPPTNYLTPPP
ncbi:MAG: transglycosylase SLT domain-containing protein [Pseudomonadota bacterium]